MRFNINIFIPLLTLFATLMTLMPSLSFATTLGVNGNGKATIDGNEEFILGTTYFDGVRWRASDLDYLRQREIKLIRVLLENSQISGTTNLFNSNGSLINSSVNSIHGLIAAANSRGMIVDLTILSWCSGDYLQTETARRNAVTNAASQFGGYSNVLFDVVNEHNNTYTCPGTTTPNLNNIRTYISIVKSYTSAPVTVSSITGSEGELVDYSNQVSQSGVDGELSAGVDIFAPHFSRDADWSALTDERVSAIRGYLASIGQLSKGVYLQEEQRRGWEGANPSIQEFLDAAVLARDAGAMMWIFHTDAGFVMSGSSYVSQLDSEELIILDSLKDNVFGGSLPQPINDPAPMPMPTGNGSRLEVEDMQLTGLLSEMLPDASNLAAASLAYSSANSGSAQTSFPLESGYYDLKLGYYDESDGAGTFAIKVNNVTAANFTANKNTSGSGSADSQSYREEIVATYVYIDAGATILLTSTKNSGENGRMDYIEFIPVGFPIVLNPDPDPIPQPTGSSVQLEAENMQLSGLLVESLSAASSGAAASLAYSSATSGTAQASFNLPTAYYNVSLGYFDESDGESVFTVEVNGAVIASFVANQNTSGSAMADDQSRRVDSIASAIYISQGANIKISSTKDNGENGRIDFIEFMAVGAAEPQPEPIPEPITEPNPEPISMSPSLILSPSVTGSGDTIQVTFSRGQESGNCDDYITIKKPGGGSTGKYVYVNGTKSQTGASGCASGTVNLTVPNNPGTYDVQYRLFDHTTIVNKTLIVQ